MTLVLHEFLHIIVGLIIVLVNQRKRGWEDTAWILLSTLFIDIDHLLDYFLALGPIWNLEALSTGSYFLDSGRVIVILHSWEFALMLLIFSEYQSEKPKVILFGLGLGVLGHLMVDQLWYAQPLGTYFLIARILNSFVDPLYW